MWSECTEACDGGTRTRSRTCLNADNTKCLGGTTEIENCNTFSCERSKSKGCTSGVLDFDKGPVFCACAESCLGLCKFFALHVPD